MQFKVPLSYTLPEVFDLYFKLHSTFNIKYESSLMKMMSFCEKFIYKMETTFKPSNGILYYNSISK